MNYINELITGLTIGSLLYKNLLFNDPNRRPICLSTTGRSVGRSVSRLPVGVSVCLFVCLFVCLSADVCLCLCIYVSVCLYACFVYRSVCRWSVCRSVGLYVCLSLALGQFVCGQSVYVPVCVPQPVYIRLSTCLSLSLVGWSVGRQCSLSELSVSHSVHEACRQRRGGC